MLGHSFFASNIDIVRSNQSNGFGSKRLMFYRITHEWNL